MKLLRRHSRERVPEFQPIAEIAADDSAAIDGKLPPIEFNATLNEIFKVACEGDPELKKQLEASAHLEPTKKSIRRPTGFSCSSEGSFEGRPTLVRVSTPPPLLGLEDQPRPRKDPGALRTTDVRVYGTLDDLLSPGWEPPSPAVPAPAAPDPEFQAPGSAGSRASVVSQQSSKRASVAAANKRPSMAAGAEASRRQSNRMSVSFSAGIRDGGMSTAGGQRKSMPSVQARRFALKRMSMEAGAMRRGSTGNRRGSSLSFGMARTDKLDDDSDLEDSDLASSSSGSDHSAEGKALLDELKEPVVSGDWSLMLAAARDQMIDKRGSSGMPQIRFQDESSDDHGRRPSVTVIAEPELAREVSSWKLKGPKRARSPLKPGVYVGYENPLHPGSSLHGGPPKGLPQQVRAAHGSGRFPQLSSPIRPATSDVITRARQLPGDGAVPASANVWHDIISKIENPGRSEESKAYDNWRKKVVECTRTMHLEVNRFRSDEPF
jgi:hypothetical protein